MVMIQLEFLFRIWRAAVVPEIPFPMITMCSVLFPISSGKERKGFVVTMSLFIQRPAPKYNKPLTLRFVHSQTIKVQCKHHFYGV